MPWNPLVSVLTPSFNQARWIGDNLHSVAIQTHDRIEHIVVDGRSTDGTVEKLRQDAGPKVRWWSESDAGQSDALNRAFARARGEIIGWLNSDDAYFSAETVATVVAALDRHPEVDVAYGHAALVNADGLVLQISWAPPMSKRLLALHNFIIQPTAFIRRRALDDLLVDPEFESMMDRELWLRLADRCRFGRINRILAIDRHHPDRKVVARPDLAARDKVRFAATRPGPSGPWTRPVRKAFKVAFRLVGSTRIPEAMRTDLAFSGRIDHLGSLLLRQVAVPRSRMRFHDEPSKTEAR